MLAHSIEKSYLDLRRFLRGAAAGSPNPLPGKLMFAQFAPAPIQFLPTPIGFIPKFMLIASLRCAAYRWTLPPTRAPFSRCGAMARLKSPTWVSICSPREGLRGPIGSLYWFLARFRESDFLGSVRDFAVVAFHGIRTTSASVLPGEQ